MALYSKKRDFPVSNIRRLLEPGPIVLVSSSWRGKANVMTMGWHTVMEFTPSLVGCVISESSSSFEMIAQSGECVINVPTRELAKKVAGIGNCCGKETDKFKKFKLTAVPAVTVKAPLIEECYANLECKLFDRSLITKYNFFIFEVRKAHAAALPKFPRTIHYYGEGMFMVAGGTLNLKRLFKKENL